MDLAYQYDTNPKKFYTGYDTPLNNGNKKKSKKKRNKSSNKQVLTKRERDAKEIRTKIRSKIKENKKRKRNIIIMFIIISLIVVMNLFMQSIAQERLSAITDKKEQIEELKKENTQLKLQLKNKQNLAQIEEKAINKFGMRKVSKDEIIKIRVKKEDFVESAKNTN